MKKKFYGNASLVLDFCFEIEADSLEEAKEKVLGATMLDFELLDEDGEKVLKDWQAEDWYVIDKPKQGNIRESGIHGLEIDEGEEY